MSSKTKFFIALCVLISLIIGFIFTNTYDRNYFKVLVNEQEISFYLNEKFDKTYVPKLVHSKNFTNDWLISGEHKLNEIQLSDNIKMNVIEYICLNKKEGSRINCGSYYTNGSKPILKDTENKPYKLKIEKKNVVIYEGDYINDISNYITEEGRYYFTVNLLRNDSKMTEIDSEIIFNIKFVGV